jgi:deoxyribonuclease (pyrimidine dimer)
MTRINAGVMPSELHNKHLLAEHREIKRIPNAIAKGKYNLDNIPDKFTLGTGHVKFFYNKLLYLHFRYLDLYSECVKRGFNVTCYNSCFFNMPDELYNDYTPKKQDRQIILDRIAERIENSKVM